MRDIELQEITDTRQPFQPEDLFVNIDDVGGDGLITIHMSNGTKRKGLVATMTDKDDEAVSYAVLFSESPGLLAAAKKLVEEGDCYGNFAESHSCILMSYHEEEWCGHCQTEKAIERAEAHDE